MDVKKYCKKYPDFTLEDANKIEEEFKIFSQKDEIINKENQSKKRTKEEYKSIVKWVFLLLYPGLFLYLYIDSFFHGIPSLYDIILTFLFPTLFISMVLFILLIGDSYSKNMYDNFIYYFLQKFFGKDEVYKEAIQEDMYNILKNTGISYNSYDKNLDENNTLNEDNILKKIHKNGCTIGIGNFYIPAMGKYGDTDDFILETIEFTGLKNTLSFKDIKILDDVLDSSKFYKKNLFTFLLEGCFFVFGFSLLLSEENQYGHRTYDKVYNFVDTYFYYLIAAVLGYVFFKIVILRIFPRSNRKKTNKINNLSLELEYDIDNPNTGTILNNELLFLLESFRKKVSYKREYVFLFRNNSVFIKLHSLGGTSSKPLSHSEKFVLYYLEIQNLLKLAEDLKKFYIGNKAILEKVA